MANSKTGNSTLTWSASEYIDHQRGASWYLLLIGGTVTLAAGVYFLTKDIFATVIIVVLGLIIGSVAHWKPRQVEYELSASGLKASEKSYLFSQFKSFYIIHEGDLTSLCLTPTKRFMPPVSAFFDENDEPKIIDIIGDHLPMENQTQDRIDRLSRRLRF